MQLRFTIDDVMRYHGPHSPGGVAIAYKALERALPLLSDPPERRDVAVRTAFGGPGARDAFEYVLRAVTGERYIVDPALAPPQLGPRARFVFVFVGGGRTVTLVLRDGFVTEELVGLAGLGARDPGQEARLTTLKAELAQRVLAARAEAVF